MRILIADDDIGLIATLKNIVEKSFPDLDIVALDNPLELIKRSQSEIFELAILDMSFGENYGDLGLIALRKLLANNPKTRVIILTANQDKRLGWEAIKSGALFFINKPFELESLMILLGEAIKQYQIRDFAQHAEVYFEDEIFFGKSTVAEELRKKLIFCSKNDLPVLILGETGTGKSYLARLIHNLHERRKKGRFCVYQPGLTNEEMVYVELFGAKKGAYTGLLESKIGLVELSNSGTLFLDEITDLPSSIQVMLLRVLNDKVFRRLGETEDKGSDFRLISATNKDIKKCILDGRFREDLYTRIAGITIEIPPLRERREDIPHLAERLLSKICKKEEVSDLSLSNDCLDYLTRLELKGNIRELNMLLERGFQTAVFEGASTITREHIIEEKIIKSANGLNEMVDEFKKRVIQNELHLSNWNVSEAARRLKIDRTQLRRLIQRFGIER